MSDLQKKALISLIQFLVAVEWARKWMIEGGEKDGEKAALEISLGKSFSHGCIDGRIEQFSAIRAKRGDQRRGVHWEWYII